MAIASVCRDMSGPLALLDASSDDPSRVLPPFDDLYASHAANVDRFCLSQLGDAEAAADVTQEAFIKAFSAYERVSPDPQTARTWLISTPATVASTIAARTAAGGGLSIAWRAFARARSMSRY